MKLVAGAAVRMLSSTASEPESGATPRQWNAPGISCGAVRVSSAASTISEFFSIDAAPKPSLTVLPSTMFGHVGDHLGGPTRGADAPTTQRDRRAYVSFGEGGTT